MQWEGNLRKLETSAQANEHGQVAYSLRGADVLQALPPEEINAWVGERLRSISGAKFIAACLDRVLRKTYGEGMSYQAWSEHPAAVESVLRPELSRIHEGIALRDFEWEQKHHNQPHYVYISQTGAFKVGVTRPPIGHTVGTTKALWLRLRSWKRRTVSWLARWRSP